MQERQKQGHNADLRCMSNLKLHLKLLNNRNSAKWVIMFVEEGK